MDLEMKLREWSGLAFYGQGKDARPQKEEDGCPGGSGGKECGTAEAGYLQEGVKAVFEFPHTADLRDYDSIVFRMGTVGREDIWLDVVLRPLRIGRPEFVERAAASVCLPAEGGICRVPFTAFDHSRIVNAHMKYIDCVEVMLRREHVREPEVSGVRKAAVEPEISGSQEAAVESKISAIRKAAEEFELSGSQEAAVELENSDVQKAAEYPENSGVRKAAEEPGSPLRVRIDKISFSTGAAFRARAICASRSGEAGQRLVWKAALENCGARPLLLAASENRSGRESFPLEYDRKIRLAPGETLEVEISGILPEEIAPGGFEARILQWVPCGENLPEQSLTLYAGRKPAHPFLLHREKAWTYLKELLERDTGLARRFREEYEKVAKAFTAPEPAEDRGYVYVSETQNSFLKTAIAWKLTGKEEYLEQLLAYFRGFLDGEKGYLRTEHPYFQFIRSREEWKKGDAACPFPVHRACSAGWVQEGEFMTKMAFVYDLLYDRKEFTGQMHREMERCMRAYMEFAEWRLTDGDGNNFQLAEASAALYFACLLQDYPRIERFLSGSNGLYELMGAVFSDDGSYFEAATNYVRLAAEILLHAANACENFGLNLKDAAVPASYDRQVLHAPWARRQEWAADGKPFLGMSFERFGANRKPVRRLREFIDQITTLLTPEGILFSVNDSNEQSLIPILDMACYLYDDPAYQSFCDPQQERDFLFGPHMADWKRRERQRRQGRGQGSRLVEGGGFAILRQQKGHFCQAVLKYGQHGGYHGHYDRLGLVSFLRDNRTYHNQEFTWYGYDSFLFKMWVQASVAHDMVVVDRRMQEPAPCQCIYFEEQEAFSAVCAQTVCRWSDPPYGGQTPYPVEFPEEKCRREGRFLLAPPAVREQGDIGEYSEPVFQRRLMVLIDGCLYVWDYLEAEGEHEFDCLYHPFGSARINGLRHVKSVERFDENPYGAAQFVTDCHWFQAEGVTEVSLSNRVKRVNSNDRLDYVERTRLFGIFPQKGSVMIGRYPMGTDTFQEAQVRSAEQLLSDGCRKTVSFHQEGSRARFVTALEIGGGESGIRDIRCDGYDSVVVKMEDGSVKRLTVRGMDDRAAEGVKVTVS